MPESSWLPLWLPEAVWNHLKALCAVVVIESPHVGSVLPQRVTSSGTRAVPMSPRAKAKLVAKNLSFYFLPRWNIPWPDRHPETNTHISSLTGLDFFFFVNAKSSTQAIASWSAVWKVTNPPFSVWKGQASIMCSIVCSSPEAYSGLGLLPHLWRLAKQGSWPVLNLDSHSFSQADWVEKFVSGFFFQIGRLDGRRAVGGLVDGENLWPFGASFE